jgi:outer membrane murein-binding lipoprotein Lpp
MTVEQKTLINGLNDKIRQLLLIYEHTKTERNALREELTARNAKINELSMAIRELEEKNKKLQLADAFKVSSEDTREAKLKIGRIVREIDKCMALLNN